MRGRSRNRRQTFVPRTRIPGEITEARERVESKWFACSERDPSMADLVTAKGARREPFHRWLTFKQTFSPELVRAFMQHLDEGGESGDESPLLDPFSGTGTFVTECARQGKPALGVDALIAAAFVRNTDVAQIPDTPDLTGCESWPDIADRLTDRVHRAALICTIAAQTTARGTLNKNAPPIAGALHETLEVMRDDLRTPLKTANVTVRGDGRALDFIANGSIGGILTSPPYLSRHDYAKLTLPFESVYAHWYGRPQSNQVPASPRAAARPRRGEVPPAVAEACDALNLIDQRRMARVVHAYFVDMIDCLRNCARVLKPGAPCWLVIGGARIKDVYIPSDSILADQAAAAGLPVRRFVVARNLVPGGRNLGRLANITPRESILQMRKD